MSPARRARSRTSRRTLARSRGVTSSAAAEGVAARTSAAKSASVVSVSWPTAETTGIADAAIARTTASSLNAHRSSSEPPPRPTMSDVEPAEAIQARDGVGDLRCRALALHEHGREHDAHAPASGA